MSEQEQTGGARADWWSKSRLVGQEQTGGAKADGWGLVRNKNHQKHEMLMKRAPVAPIWLRIGVTSIVFREESEYGTPGAQFRAKRSIIAKHF